MREKSAIRLGFLPVNQCYAFLFGSGDSIEDLSILSMGVEEKRFFESREAAEQAANDRGLTIKPNGDVISA